MSDTVATLSPVLLEGLRQLHLQLSTHQYEQLLRYRQELLDWNTRVNLTAIKEPEDVDVKHFLDSLSLLAVYDQLEAHVLDIGSGAGFPGLALKIIRPAWHVTSLEATGKKTTFQQHIIDTLQLTNTVTIHARAEELAQQQAYRGMFDMVTARAVAALPALLEYCAPYCRVEGVIVLPKKGDLAAELAQGKRAATQVGAVLKADVPVTLSGLDDGRRLLVWEQKKRCPALFPRSGAAMAKKPLGTG